MKYCISVLIAIGLLISCQSDAEKAQEKADEMIAEALANAKKMEEETNARVVAITAQIEADVARKQEEVVAEKARVVAAEKEQVRLAKVALEHRPNKALSQYNGFYVENRNHHGALIFIDGKLTHFNCSRFKTVQKNEEYNISGITSENFLDTKAQYYKDRKGNVAPKATILHDINPTLNNGVCTKMERRGWTFPRVITFKAFMKTRGNFSMNTFLSEFKAKYNRTDDEIEKALINPDFYKCDFFTKAPFYGEMEPLVDALESIIQL